MLNDIQWPDHIQCKPQLIRLYTELDLLPNLVGFHRTFAMGVACRQGTLTPPVTWSRPFCWGYFGRDFGIFSHFCLKNLTEMVRMRDPLLQNYIDWSIKTNLIVQIKLKFGRLFAHCNTLIGFSQLYIKQWFLFNRNSNSHTVNCQQATDISHWNLKSLIGIFKVGEFLHRR